MCAKIAEYELVRTDMELPSEHPAGYGYVISNIGAFGESVHKIG
ncbi:hypothetical protein J3A64_001744 [Pseudarthrobacter sp. PvP004]|nr:hypothetical protein [Pseudarthrobacter sp. PvP004]MBP2266280.1 hypothetical protein [Pseudarthrobacter sp. PvP004]